MLEFYQNQESTKQINYKNLSKSYFKQSICLYKVSSMLRKGDEFGEYTKFSKGPLIVVEELHALYLSTEMYAKIFSPVFQKINFITKSLNSYLQIKNTEGFRALALQF